MCGCEFIIRRTASIYAVDSLATQIAWHRVTRRKSSIFALSTFHRRIVTRRATSNNFSIVVSPHRQENTSKLSVHFETQKQRERERWIAQTVLYFQRTQYTLAYAREISRKKMKKKRDITSRDDTSAATAAATTTTTVAARNPPCDSRNPRNK